MVVALWPWYSSGLSEEGASRTLDTAIPTTTNEAYATTNILYATPHTAKAVQATANAIDTEPNAAYAATGIATSVNEAYQPVQGSNAPASRTLDTAIPTTTNEAYAATNIGNGEKTVIELTPYHQ